MEPFSVYILGCGSALPTLRHYASSQVIRIRDRYMMVDCGEGTQMQLRRTHVHFNKLSVVFISHIHGDHCFGLIGMISTFGMLGRTAPLHIYAPKELEPMLKSQMDMFCQGLEYEVVFHQVDTYINKVIYEDRTMAVETIPLEHRIPCCGFLFREKETLPHIRRDMIDFYHIPLSQINNIKNGAGWETEDGVTIPHERLTTPAEKPRSYAYCSDTRYMKNLSKMLKGVDMLYHESTYMKAHEDRASLYWHSTAEQAAKVALEAGVGKLLLGHYSARYNNEDVLLEEARVVFSNSFLAQEGMVFDV